MERKTSILFLYTRVWTLPCVRDVYNSQEITKLDSKSRKCTFLGYDDNNKGYHLWDPTACKVVVGKDLFEQKKKLHNE